MKYIEWFEEKVSYYKILYIFYGIISATIIREIPYFTTIFSAVMVMLSFVYFCIFYFKGYYFKMCKLRYLLFIFLLIQLSSFVINNNVYGRLDEHYGINKVLTGITININTLGVLCTILIVFSIHLLISKRNTEIKKGLLLFSILIGVVTLLYTEARGAMLALGVYLFSLFLFSIKNKLNSIMLLMITVIVSFIFIDKLISIKGIEALSSGRSLLWITGINVIMRNPVWGVGTTAFVEVVKNSTSMYLPGIDQGGLHNIYIQIATANGCIALILFLIFILSIICIGIKRVKHSNSLIEISLLSIIISFLSLNLVESGLIYIMSFIALIFWVCIGEFIKNIELE